MHKNQAQNVPHHHPEDYPRDLNPDYLAGQNYGVTGPRPEMDARSANDIKEIHDLLPDLSDDELRGIPIMPEGSRLEQGARYIDLADRQRGEFTARGDMEAGPNNYYVPKSEVDYALYNRLRGVDDPARLDTPGGS